MRILLFIISSLAVNISAYSQRILWEYSVEDGRENLPWGMAVGGDDNLYINISNPDPPLPNGNLSAYNRVYLLGIDLAGNYKSSLYVKGCKNRTSLIPFGKNRFLSYGHNCIKGRVGRFSYDSRTFNRRGKLKRVGEALPGNKFSTHIDTNKITFFSKQLGFYRGATIYYGVMNKRLEVSMDSIDVSVLQREGYGMNMGFGRPRPLGDNSWLIPFYHGVFKEGSSSTMRPRFGGYAVARDGKVVDRYYPERKSYFISAVSSSGSGACALFRNVNRSDNTFLFVNENGEIANEFCVNLKRSERVRVLNYDNGAVHLLTDQSILRFDTMGVERMNFIFPPETFDWIQGMIVLKDGAYIVSGSKDKQAKIIKIGRSYTAPGEGQIHFANIETVPDEVAAVSLYPNPTSSSLNIEITHADKEATDLCDIRVYDFNGNLVKKASGRLPSLSVPIEDLIPGTYLYKIVTETGEMFTGKFIKV